MTSIDFGISRPKDFQPTPQSVLDETLVPTFEAIVEKFPDKTAVRSPKRNLTYRQLNNAVNHLAQEIGQRTGANRSPVGVMFDDELMSVVVLLAVLKSGRPFLGVHPENSKAQVKSILSDSSPQLLIIAPQFLEKTKKVSNTSAEFMVVEHLKTEQQLPNPSNSLRPDDAAALLYTSGSSGKPKGVIWGHNNLANMALRMNNQWFISPSDHISMMTSIYFGAAYPSVLCSLSTGATLCIFNLKQNSAKDAIRWIFDESISIFRSTPSIFRSIFGLMAEGKRFDNLRFMTLGGEPVTRSDIALFKAHTAPDCVLVNNYSSSETGAICHFPVHHSFEMEDERLPAGYPAPAKEILLLDENEQPVRGDQTGMIAVRSEFLSLGYWGDPQLTAQTFYKDPLDPSKRLFYTGDLGRWREDGILEVLGRQDTQVKVRGYRIQLESIDQALRAIPGVTDAATVVHSSESRGARLIAYYAEGEGTDIPQGTFREHLKETLPEYMIPTYFVRLDSLPRTTSGKLARRDLPPQSRQRPDIDVPYRPPETEVESQVASIWAELLELERVGLDEDFFELGGDSLLALEMTLAVEQTLDQRLPQAFFKNPTISYLLSVLDSAEEAGRKDGPFELQSFGGKTGETQRKSLRRSKKRLLRPITAKDVSRLTEILVARRMVGMPFPEARAWAVRWSDNPFAGKFLYSYRHAQFNQFVKSIGAHLEEPIEAFRQNLLANSYYGFVKPLVTKRGSGEDHLDLYLASPKRFWRTLGQLLENIDEGKPLADFPIIGPENVTRELSKGKGTILITYHGSPRLGGMIPLQRYLGVGQIETISFRTPLRQSKFEEKKGAVPLPVASTLNAEIALYGQRKLEAGEIINFVSDNSDRVGHMHLVEIGGRSYQIKSGFADLAINTGADVIPHFKRCLPDGRVEHHLCPPLPIEGRTREAQVNSLLNGYARFVEQTWRAYPESLKWSRIEHHLAPPSALE